jgi:hypothetical protein
LAEKNYLIQLADGESPAEVAGGAEFGAFQSPAQDEGLPAIAALKGHIAVAGKTKNRFPELISINAAISI